MILYEQQHFWLKLSDFLKVKKKEKRKLKLDVHLPIFHNFKFLRQVAYDSIKVRLLTNQSKTGMKKQVTFPELIR